MADTSLNVKKLGLLLAVLIALGIGVRLRCAKPGEAEADAGPAPARAHGASLKPPIAAASVGGGVVLAAALDSEQNGVRVQRIDANDAVTADRLVLDDVAITPDAELKLAASAEGVALTFRGVRGGKLTRQLVLLGPDLAPKGPPVEVSAAYCATREGVWTSDGTKATSHLFKGGGATVALPKDKDASLFCAPHRAYAVLDDDDKTSAMPLGAEGAGAALVMRDADFGEDEQRELAEYAVGDEIGFVRLGASGALALREKSGPLRNLKTRIGRDDDVVAVDASAKYVVIVYTEEAPEDADVTGSGCTKVLAVRVDRQSWDEAKVELSSGRCGHEVGPFFTSALGDGVSVAWPERSGGVGQARAPIVALAHAVVAAEPAPKLTRFPENARALVDATCDAASCYAVALEDSGLRVLRYR